MKDYARILSCSQRAVLQETMSIKKKKGEPLQWNALQLIENMAHKMRGRLRAVLSDDLSEEVRQVKVNLTGEPEKGAQLFLKAQFFRLSNKELVLKVFAHQVNSKGRTEKLAKASYHIHIGRKEISRVA